MRLIDADYITDGRVSNDPVVIAAKCAPTIHAIPVEWLHRIADDDLITPPYRFYAQAFINMWAQEKEEMCNVYHKRDCCGCPLNNGDCGVLNMRFTDVNTVQRVETTVMQWAAEHPEPVYPTWREYLQEQGILDVEYIPAASSTTSTSKSYVQTVKTLAPFYRPIPADIAQKLGLQPKEG